MNAKLETRNSKLETRTEAVVLDVKNLTKHFPVRKSGFLGGKRWVHAVDDVSFELRRGEILSLVGESGSGKSTIARLLVRLYPATSGAALLHGNDVLKLHGRRAMLRYRSQVQMVFQDPFGSLNPVKTVGYHIEQSLKIRQNVSNGDSSEHEALEAAGGEHSPGRFGRNRGERVEHMYDLLRTVGLTPPQDVALKLPSQLSGGQRQRVSFARALAVDPEVVLADEPISMLDVSIRMGILNLMGRLRQDRGISYLYITHDLASARYLADRVLVLYAGQTMELGAAEEIMRDPLHPYTKLLLSAVPSPRHRQGKIRIESRGEIPTVIDPQPGCRFAARCPAVMERCRSENPGVYDLGRNRLVRCFLYENGQTITPASALPA